MTMAPGRSATSGAQSRGRRSPTDDDRVGLDALLRRRRPAAARPRRPDARERGSAGGCRAGRPSAAGEAGCGSRPGCPWRGRRRESRSVIRSTARGDAQLHGADGGPPSESVVHDDEVRRAAQPLGARGQSLGGASRRSRGRRRAAAPPRRRTLRRPRRTRADRRPWLLRRGAASPRPPQPCAVVVEQREPALAMRGRPRPRPARRRRPSRAPRRRPRSPRPWRA